MKQACVYLIGAGPGDPDLLTVKAHHLLQRADVVVFDRLVSDEVLDIIPRGATKINVGKQPNRHPVPQEEINELLVALGRTERTIIRLKGGDPFLFGRGGEEALALQKADIPFEIVPGITAAQGCSASLGLPLTYRGIASGVRYITGHCRANADLDFDWEGLTDPQTTLVIYMGLTNIEQISTELIARGRASDTPVLAISRGTLADESRLISTLGEISTAVKVSQLPSPILFIVGSVVTLASFQGQQCNAPTQEQMVAAS